MRPEPSREASTDNATRPAQSIDGDGTMTFSEAQPTSRAAPQGPLLPVVELSDAGELMLKAATTHAASTAARDAARALLPEIDMRAEMRRFNAAPSVAAARPAQPASLPQPPLADPLAALKAMSDDELIALFS
jgi:hypothetical protein